MWTVDSPSKDRWATRTISEDWSTSFGVDTTVTTHFTSNEIKARHIFWTAILREKEGYGYYCSDFSITFVGNGAKVSQGVSRMLTVSVRCIGYLRHCKISVNRGIWIQS